ncbi:ABC transporter substrate-binding protein [Paenibacillus peoriae]|uniref:ABC transporter substrate-binding protein n=1 Tax=Paenibacillus peoriae TaxID=59893 RepID=UPI00026C5804|nr:ABC transporter substrate-binding protein [Paenibacillus peoriae]MEC0182720.1 ABC transporter substrate-binding protein [Paenibacillus peoriae]
MVKNMKWKSLTMIISLVMMLIVQGCGVKGSGNDPKASGSSEGNTKPITITWWHSMGGDNGKAIDQIVSDFNASQSKIMVKATFQGNYDESLNKLKASLGSDTGPALVQVNDVGTRFMIDSGAAVPVQSYIDKEKYDISKMEPNILNYYKIDHKLYSMPFNSSTAILYYNKDLFKAAGLDPEKPPTTFDELTKAAQKLSAKGIMGLSLYIEPWFMEQFFAVQGADYVDHDNGRTSPATQSLANTEAGVKTLTWWKALVDGKLAHNYGRTADDAKMVFTSGQAAMMLNSTGALRGIVNTVGGKFEVGTGQLPKAEPSQAGGTIVGGASNWILGNKSQEEQDAAWEFIKYLSSPKVQAYWSVNSGYFPITTAAYEEQSVQDNLKKYPQFMTAINQIHETKSNFANQGAVMGVFQEQRQFISNAIEEVLNGVKTPQDALNEAAVSSTGAIQQYNQTK